MAYLVQRYRAADGTYHPDYDEVPRGRVVYENTVPAAIKAYGRIVLGREEYISEDDQFVTQELGNEAYHKVTSRKLSLRFSELDDDEV